MKRDLTIAVIALVLVSAVCYGLSIVRPALPPTPSHPFVEAKGTSGSTAHPVGRVIMRVNGEPITEAEFNAFERSAPAESRGFYTTPQGKRALADELVKLKTLEQEAHRLGLAADPEVATQVDARRAQILAGRALDKLVRDEVAKSVNAQLELEKKQSVELKHIVFAYEGSAIPPRNGGAPPSVDEAMRRANAALQKIKSGADFGAVASAESDDPQSAARGGSVGVARMEMLPAEVAAVVSHLKPGELSAPVRTQFGVHIFKVDTPSVEELRPQLTQRMQQQAIELTAIRRRGPRSSTC